MSRTFLKLNLTASGKVKIPPSRLAPMTREAMDEAHKAVYDSIVNSARGVKPKKDGSLGGPFNSYAYASPEICHHRSCKPKGMHCEKCYWFE